MRFPRLLLAATLLLAAFARPLAAIDVRPPLLFPPAAGSTDLSPDPALVLGELANGLRYAIRANPEPRARAALRLVVAAGSLHETEAQRGLAHFLEHMAFNGSEHYAPGTLVDFFQRMGMNFGGDTNAYTSFDRTVYMLDLPDTRPATIAEGFRVLSDFADRLLLKPEEIDRERGVVLSEKLARDSADYRAAIAGYQFFLGSSLLPSRLPIGLEPVLKTAARDQFADFYDTWYRPARLAVIAVGDLDPAAAETQLREAFTPLADRGPARPTPDFAVTPDPTAPRFGHHYEPEASATSVCLQAVRPPDYAPDTAAKRLRELPRELAYAMLNRRLAELAKVESAPFVRAVAGHDAFPAVFDGAEFNLTARPGQWAETLAVGENELRRALRFGFRAAELREALADQRNALEQAVKTDATRRSEQRADALVDAYIEGAIPTTPAAELALLGPALDQATLEECHEALKADWSSANGVRVAVIGNAKLGDGTPDSSAAEVARVYTAAEKIEVAAPADRIDAPWAYEDFGPAGAITSRHHVEDLDIDQVVFTNGVRLNLKRTAFAVGAISLQARVGDGQLTEPRDQPGLAFFGNVAFTAGGLGQHSADELRRILAGRNVALALKIAPDALTFAGDTTPADLVLQLQFLAAQITDPGYRPEAELSARRQLEPYYARLATDPSGPLKIKVPRLLAAGDPRFGLPRPEEASSRTLAELRAWLTPQLTAGPIELSLVGDLDPETTIAAVAATLGALPPRAPKPTHDELRRIELAPAGEQALAYAGAIPKDVLALYWPTADARDISRVRRLNLLAEILGNRLLKTIREELGGSYSPNASNQPNDTFPAYNFIAAQIVLNPDDLDRIRPAVLGVAANLVAKGVEADELNRARQPILTMLRESERTNAYWVRTVLGAAQEQPWLLDWARRRRADYEAVTLDELNTLARAYLDPSRAIVFVIKPAAQ
jgi:zinc protease